ncbi:MAG: transketolase [Burkholderiales bacterium]|nr:transketolase [Burkholderiales bacterium]
MIMPDAAVPTSVPSSTLLANAIRALSMDAVEQAKSGHPGMPMGMAEIAVALWAQGNPHRHYRHNPANPTWPNRDRFVVSNGHGSMLHYALLHLSGYDLPMQELKQFRQLHSKTPGHPEVHVTPGVETTTGPLGQGISNAVGMALAEYLLASEFNRPGLPVVDHYTYVFLGDGCLMEGISHEACSLAGALRLNKLIALYDDNGISIDGKVEGWFRDDTPKRFEAYGWNVITPVDGHDVAAVSAAIAQAKDSERPTLICCKTVIGKGSPNKAGSEDAHGSALGEKEIALTRAALGWQHAPFEIPAEVYAGFDARTAGQAAEQAWNELMARYAQQYPAEASELQRRLRGDLPANWHAAVQAYLQTCEDKKESIPTRKASLNALNAYAKVLPELLGGSADLTGSVYSQWSGATPLRAGQPGQHINYGVREFGMSAILNGIVLHGGFKPFGGTFLTFSDYSRNAIRMAALMKTSTMFLFTHDSIGLGEDGPTHQSVEHISSLRLIPNLDVWRPADTTESALAWAAALERKNGPSALCFSRQNTVFLNKTEAMRNNIARGAYVLVEADKPQAVLIATGSEVGLALEAQQTLAQQGVAVRVVSMPCTSVFDRQDAAYRAQVLPKGLPRVAIEAGVTDYWRKYVGLEGEVIGIDTFGESAPAGVLFKHFGLTPDKVVAAVKRVISV